MCRHHHDRCQLGGHLTSLGIADAGKRSLMPRTGSVCGFLSSVRSRNRFSDSALPSGTVASRREPTRTSGRSITPSTKRTRLPGGMCPDEGSSEVGTVLAGCSTFLTSAAAAVWRGGRLYGAIAMPAIRARPPAHQGSGQVSGIGRFLYRDGPAARPRSPLAGAWLKSGRCAGHPATRASCSRSAPAS